MYIGAQQPTWSLHIYICLTICGELLNLSFGQFGMVLTGVYWDTFGVALYWGIVYVSRKQLLGRTIYTKKAVL